MILSVTKMILIYLNYRLWISKLKDIYGEVLDTLLFDRNLDVFDMYRLFLFLWSFELIYQFWQNRSPARIMVNITLTSLAPSFDWVWVFAPRFKHKKVLSWFMIAFINSYGCSITLDSNPSNWKWRRHNF